MLFSLDPKIKMSYLTYLLTYSVVQSPSWEANWFAANQEIPRISRNTKVHYRTHKRPPPVSILGQLNPVHIPTSHLLKIHLNIVHPSTPRSPQWSPSLRFPHQDPIHPLSSPIRAICPAHLILFDFITRTILGEECKSFSSIVTSGTQNVADITTSDYTSQHLISIGSLTWYHITAKERSCPLSSLSATSCSKIYLPTALLL